MIRMAMIAVGFGPKAFGRYTTGDCLTPRLWVGDKGPGGRGCRAGNR
jgi:hypothetical protein